MSPLEIMLAAAIGTLFTAFLALTKEYLADKKAQASYLQTRLETTQDKAAERELIHAEAYRKLGTFVEDWGTWKATMPTAEEFDKVLEELRRLPKRADDRIEPTSRRG